MLSGFTGRVGPGFLTPGSPTLSGEPVAGLQLTADAGDWGPGDIELGYQWYRDGLLVPDAFGDTYALTELDAGHVISVLVSGRREGYLPAEVWSAPVGPVVGRER